MLYKKDFCKYVVFSPDGYCAATFTEDNYTHIYQLPIELYENKQCLKWEPIFSFKHAGPVHDLIWYRLMNSYGVYGIIFNFA
jgi:hypothetical protein